METLVYICICNNVTEGQIRDCVENQGVRRIAQLRKLLGACSQCGKCALATRQTLERCLHENEPPDEALDLEPAGALNYG